MTKDNQEQPDISHTQPSTPQISCNLLFNFIIMLNKLISIEMYCKKNLTVNQNENWMRHGYPTTMGHGTPITILKRGPGGTSQIDPQVRKKSILIMCYYYYYFLFLHTLYVVKHFI